MAVFENIPDTILDQKLAELNLNEKPIDHSNEFPFLIDEKTINFINKSKVIFINRGLPGSGKSTLSRMIANVYKTTRICSADDFFLDEHGNYNFDINKRPQAHEVCKQKAENSCSESISPVIIDNTNLMYWEIKHYLHLAKQYDYLVMIVEPRTSHKFDIHKLALYNKHGVLLEALKTKLEQYQIILPYYFGWFLNFSDSTRLLDQAKPLFKQALNLFPDFEKEIILKHSN